MIVALTVIYLMGVIISFFLFTFSNMPIDETTAWFMSILWPITTPITIIFYTIRFFKGGFTFIKDNLITIYNLYRGLFKNIK